MLGYRASEDSIVKSIAREHHENTFEQRSVDWTGKFTTVVKNQGYCGSCW
jgi:hypothetical protein